jgi:hypothetical protein
VCNSKKDVHLNDESWRLHLAPATAVAIIKAKRKVSYSNPLSVRLMRR